MSARPDFAGAARCAKRLGELSVVLPCLNEIRNLEETVRQALKVFPGFAERLEIIIVNDGSTDGTGDLADTLARGSSVVSVIHQQNKGYGGALKAGFLRARFQWIFFSDADLQFDFGDFEKLLAHLDGADMVIGYRVNCADGYSRALLRKLLLAWDRYLFGLPADIKDVNCAFKLVSRTALTMCMPLNSDGGMISTELLLKAIRQRLVVRQVGVRHYPRQAGAQSGGRASVIVKALWETAALRKTLRQMRSR